MAQIGIFWEYWKDNYDTGDGDEWLAQLAQKLPVIEAFADPEDLPERLYQGVFGHKSDEEDDRSPHEKFWDNYIM